MVRKLEARLAQACPPAELRSKLRAQQQNTLLLQEQLETARAEVSASEELQQRCEREIYMLRSALRVHAAEFQDGSEDTVHSSLIVALAEVRHASAQRCVWRRCQTAEAPWRPHGLAADRSQSAEAP